MPGCGRLKEFIAMFGRCLNQQNVFWCISAVRELHAGGVAHNSAVPYAPASCTATSSPATSCCCPTCPLRRSKPLVSFQCATCNTLTTNMQISAAFTRVDAAGSCEFVAMPYIVTCSPTIGTMSISSPLCRLWAGGLLRSGDAPTHRSGPGGHPLVRRGAQSQSGYEP